MAATGPVECRDEVATPPWCSMEQRGVSAMKPVHQQVLQAAGVTAFNADGRAVGLYSAGQPQRQIGDKPSTVVAPASGPPPALNLAALRGIRALACATIVLGHCTFALGFVWPQRHLEWYQALERHPWLLVLVNISEPAMDLFLVMDWLPCCL